MEMLVRLAPAASNKILDVLRFEPERGAFGRGDSAPLGDLPCGLPVHARAGKAPNGLRPYCVDLHDSAPVGDSLNERRCAVDDGG
jgi:hypothetical protein